MPEIRKYVDFIKNKRLFSKKEKKEISEGIEKYGSLQKEEKDDWQKIKSLN